MRLLLGTVLLLLASCAGGPRIVMVNRQTGATVTCGYPDTQGSSGDFLVSRACLSACQAHGFRVAPEATASSSSDDVPAACSN
jgi:hypothetical protein